MFSGLHFAWIAICFAGIGIILFFSLYFKWKYKTALYTAVAFSTVSELIKVFSRIRVVTVNGGGTGGFIEPSALPLHLCSMLIFVIYLLALTKNEKLKSALLSFYVPVALAGGLSAILIPQSGVSFSSIDVWQGFVYHMCIVWFSLYVIITGQADLKIKAYVRNLIILSALVVIITWINGALQIYSREGYDDINYFFLVHPPIDGLPLLNLDNGYACYFAAVVGFGLLAVTAVHIGPIIKQVIGIIKARKQIKDDK